MPYGPFVKPREQDGAIIIGDERLQIRADRPALFDIAAPEPISLPESPSGVLSAIHQHVQGPLLTGKLDQDRVPIRQALERQGIRFHAAAAGLRPELRGGAILFIEAVDQVFDGSLEGFLAGERNRRTILFAYGRYVGAALTFAEAGFGRPFEHAIRRTPEYFEELAQRHADNPDVTEEVIRVVSAYDVNYPDLAVEDYLLRLQAAKRLYGSGLVGAIIRQACLTEPTKWLTSLERQRAALEPERPARPQRPSRARMATVRRDFAGILVRQSPSSWAQVRFLDGLSRSGAALKEWRANAVRLILPRSER